MAPAARAGKTVDREEARRRHCLRLDRRLARRLGRRHRGGFNGERFSIVGHGFRSLLTSAGFTVAVRAQLTGINLVA